MKCLAGLILFAMCALGSPDAATVLFDHGVKDVQSGNLARGRLTLQTLINTYPDSPLAAEAQDELNAGKLYDEGMARMQQGRYDAAEFTFQTLLSVYPESRLAKPAQAAMLAAARAQKSLTVGLTVRSVELKDLGLDEGEVRKLFAERELRLASGRAFDPRDVEEARGAVTRRLAETGSADALVKSEVRMAGEHEVDVVLMRVK